MDKIKCIYCGREFEITEALREHIKSQEIEKINLAHTEEVRKFKVRAEQAEENELRIRKQKEELEEEKRKFELEKQRQLDAERGKIREKAILEQSDRDKLKFIEYEKKIGDMAKAVEEANRKALQGSQQIQGEVQELNLENTLRQLFPTDEITEVKKGELGGDIRHIIRTLRGNVCGTILWESKNTKAWKEEWVDKLKEDLIRDKIHIGVIITKILPNDFKKEIGNKNGIWITTPNFVEPMANLLRKNLYDVAKEKAIASSKQDKAGQLYDFVTSHVFTQQLEQIIEIYMDMKEAVSKERASSERQWKQREMQIDRLISGVSGIYGSMQGIAGKALPQIRLLESGSDITEDK